LKLSKISDKIKIKKFEAKNVIIKSGEMGEEFYMVKTGKVDFFDNNNKYIRTLEKNDFFGEKSLLISSPRSATAIAKTYCELYYLMKEDFLKNIEKNMNEFLIQRINLQDTNIELKDLKCIRTLGSGNYGTVCLVKNKNNNVLYSIKAISIKNTVNDNMCSSLLLEKQILLQIDHQFIVKLVKSLKDKKFIYFLEEYINGKDLFDTIREIGLLSKYQNQFYSASLFLTLNFLHTKKIIFRDIKPENIMVCKNGYIKLIDFGAAKIISDQTNTIIGTPHYMAPEVIMGKGYSFQIDFWSVGI
jgi:cGMP-dependent protein kinase